MEISYLPVPVIRCLKEQLDVSEINYLTKTAFAGIPERNPQVEKVYTLENLDELLNERFDLVIDLHNNIRSLKIKSKLKSKSQSFYKANKEKWLMVNFKIDRLPKKHIVDRYLETVKALNVFKDEKGLEFHLEEKDEVIISEHFPIQERYIALVIGATYFTKRLTNEKIIELTNKLDEHIILIGG